MQSLTNMDKDRYLLSEEKCAKQDLPPLLASLSSLQNAGYCWRYASIGIVR